MPKIIITFLAATIALPAAPAFAQGRYQDSSRPVRIADEIARTIEDTAQAVARVRDSVDRSMYDFRFHGPERLAIDACRTQVERYGRMRIDHVGPYKRRSLRVYGVTEGYLSGHYASYGRREFGPRSFTCTVTDTGRVKVKTKRLARY